MKKIFTVIISFLILTNPSSSWDYLEGDKLNLIVRSQKSIVRNISGNWQKSYDRLNWSEARVPFSHEEMNTIYYRKAVSLTDGLLDRRTWHLKFLGINHYLELYINDNFIGRYFGGLTPFDVKIPQALLKDGSNVIELAISPVEDKFRQIHEQYLLSKKIYTGPVREILMIGTPNVWISALNPETVFSENIRSGRLNCKVNISSSDLEAFADMRAPEDSIRVFANQKLNATAKLVIKNNTTGEEVFSGGFESFSIESERTITKELSVNFFDVNLWDVNDPYLYRLEVILVAGADTVDTYRQNFGFREIRADAGNIYLNRKPLKIKGVCYVEDYDDHQQSLAYKVIDSDINDIKKLGANLVRCQHNAPNPYLLHAADREGLLVLAELPLYDVPDNLIGLDEIKISMMNLSKQYLEAYDNFTSLAGWGLSDGLDESGYEFRMYTREMLSNFRNSSDKLIYKYVPFGSDEIYTEGFDFIGINDKTHTKDYKRIQDELKRMKSLAGNLPLVISYGAPIQNDNHNGYSDFLSVDFQAHNISRYYKLSEKTGMAGDIINSYNDYHLQNPILIADGDDLYISGTGLADIDRNQKQSYSTLQALFNNEREPLLNAGSFSESTPVSFIISGIFIAIILVVLINRFRRFREYLTRALLRPYNFYADIRDQRIMSLWLTLLLGLTSSLTMGLFLSSVFYYTKGFDIAHYIAMLLLPNNSFKELLIQTIWMPEISFIFISFLSFVFLMIITIILRCFAFFVRARVYFTDCFTISIWSTIPLIFMLPAAIVLIRLLFAVPDSLMFVTLLFVLLLFWTIIRLFRSAAVVFDVSSGRAYLIGFGLIIFIGIIVLGIYELKYSILSYAEYFASVII